MPVIKVVLTKAFPWRGRNEEWSNGYHLSVDTVPDRAGFDTLIRAIWTGTEAPILASQTQLVKSLGYVDPAGVSTHSFTYGAYGSGTALGATGVGFGGTTGLVHPETCFLAKANAGRTTKGRNRYVMKYYHSLAGPPGDSATTQYSTMNPLLTKLINGTLPSGAKLCAPDGYVCTGISLDPYMRTHQLKRRGKRPTTP